MTRAAIYCRKSNADTGKPDEFRSVERQRAACAAFAQARRGWTVSPEHVFTDDNVGGAEFGERRPALARLLNHLAPRPAFDVVVVYHRDRLGRETLEVPALVGRLLRAGVRVFEVKGEREIPLQSATDKFLLSATAFASEVEREQARTRTTDAMVAKARARHVTGGRCFGYDNVRQPEGHVQRVVNAAEAAVVQDIFRLYASGLGLRSLAIRLNDSGAAAPLPRRQSRVRGWSVSSLHAVLRRPLYIGRVEWNRSAKRNAWGELHPARRPETDWITYDAPDLAVIDTALWAQVQQRLAAVRRSYTAFTRGKLFGRPAAPVESKHLLLGLAVCAACGGSIYLQTRAHGHGRSRRRVAFYACSTRWNRGASVCSNDVVLPAQVAEDGVLEALEQQFLHPSMIRRALDKVRATRAKQVATDRPQAIARELARMETQIDRLVDAVQLGGGGVTAIVERLRRLEERRAELRSEGDRLRHATGALSPAQLHELERDILARLSDWTGLLRRHPTETRQRLGQLLTTRMTWTPQPDAAGGAYTFAAELSLGRLVTGMLAGHSKRPIPLGATKSRRAFLTRSCLRPTGSVPK